MSEMQKNQTNQSSSIAGITKTARKEPKKEITVQAKGILVL